MNAKNVTSNIMTHHDLISSYIDNELTREQEQEFLISLAANDNLRTSFRTELTLKNLVHRDESLITPPRALRTSVFAAVGLAAAAAPEVAQAATSTSTASTVASQSSSFIKTLFATKLNAVFTTLSLSVATLVGFVGHDMIESEPASPVQQTAATNRVAAPAGGTVTNEAFGSEAIAEKPAAKTGSEIVTRIKPVPKASTNSIPNDIAKPSSDVSTSSSMQVEATMDSVQYSSPK